MTAWVLGLVALAAAIAFAAALVIVGEQEREIERLRRELAARDAEIAKLRARPPVRLLTCNQPTMIVWN